MTACGWGGGGIIDPCHLYCVSFYLLMFCNISLVGEFKLLREIRPYEYVTALLEKSASSFIKYECHYSCQNQRENFM